MIFISKFRQRTSKQSANASLASHTPRTAFARRRACARVGACSTPSTCSRPRARWVRYGYDAPGRRPRARAARAFPPPLSFSSSDRTRLTSPPRRAFADPGAPAEPRGSSEPAQIRQALRGGRVQHHHEAALSAGTSSPTRRKTSLRYDPRDESWFPSRADATTRADLSYPPRRTDQPHRRRHFDSPHS